MKDDLPGLGHNNPPVPVNLIDLIRNDVAEQIARTNDILGGVDRMPAVIDSDELASKATSFGAQIKILARDMEKLRKDYKEPFLDAGRKVDTFFKKEFSDPLARAVKIVEDRVRPYLVEKERLERERIQKEREEAERIAREEAERAAALENEGRNFAAEEAFKKAEAAESDASRIKDHKGPIMRSDEGATASVKAEYVHEIIDIDAIPLDALRQYFKPEDIDNAIKRFIRAGGRELPGVKIFEQKKLNFR